MGKGIPDFVVVNLADLEKNCEAGAEVTLDSVESFKSITGSDSRLPLKVRRCLGRSWVQPQRTPRAGSRVHAALAAGMHGGI